MINLTSCWSYKHLSSKSECNKPCRVHCVAGVYDHTYVPYKAADIFGYFQCPPNRQESASAIVSQTGCMTLGYRLTTSATTTSGPIAG